jgi:hypothetical protein
MPMAAVSANVVHSRRSSPRCWSPTIGKAAIRNGSAAQCTAHAVPAMMPRLSHRLTATLRGPRSLNQPEVSRTPRQDDGTRGDDPEICHERSKAMRHTGDRIVRSELRDVVMGEEAHLRGTRSAGAHRRLRRFREGARPKESSELVGVSPSAADKHVMARGIRSRRGLQDHVEHEGRERR